MEHILVLQILYLFYRTYSCISDIILVLRNTCISDLIHVLQSIYWSYGSYTCITEHVLVLRILYGAYFGTKVPVGTTQIHYTKVPVGTTGLVSPEGHIFVLISDSYTYTGILIHVLVLITDIYLSNLL